MICVAVIPTFNLFNSYGVESCVKMRSVGEVLTMHSEEKDDRGDPLLEDLIRRCREGDAEAQEAMYKRYKRPFFSLIFRHTYSLEASEDLLQDSFLKIFSNLHHVQSHKSFAGWAYRIVINTCYSYLRSKKSEVKKTIPLAKVERKIEADNLDVQQREMKKPLDKAVKSLPKKLRSVFLLHDVQGFKHQEIARILGCSVGTSKSQLFKARMRLREYLKSRQEV